MLGDWEQRYRHVIDLGRDLEPLSTGVPGRQQGAWLRQPGLARHRTAERWKLSRRRSRRSHRARLQSPSCCAYGGHGPEEILASTPRQVSERLGPTGVLSAQRSEWPLLDEVERTAATPAPRLLPLRRRGCRSWPRRAGPPGRASPRMGVDVAAVAANGGRAATATSWVTRAAPGHAVVAGRAGGVHPPLWSSSSLPAVGGGAVVDVV